MNLLPGPGDILTAPGWCAGGACPHDHDEPEPAVCRLCTAYVFTDDDPDEVVCDRCTRCWQCGSTDGIELVAGDPECPACRDVGGADEYLGGAA